MKQRKTISNSFRGEELYVYPPDTFLKPILILSKTRVEFAIMFQEGLNSFHILKKGLKGNWFIIEKDGNKQFNIWKRKLQNLKDGGFSFYLEIYNNYYKEKTTEQNLTWAKTNEIPDKLRDRFDDENEL